MRLFIAVCVAACGACIFGDVNDEVTKHAGMVIAFLSGAAIGFAALLALPRSHAPGQGT
jgi:hypothetical protein